MSTLWTLLTVASVHWLGMASPGPNVLLVAQTAMARSRGRALAAALGVATGALVLSSLAALGLAVAIRGSDTLLHALQTAGGAYLVYLGSRVWREARESLQQAPVGAGHGRYFARGLLTNLSNPKAIVFYASVLTAVLADTDSEWVRVAAVGVIVVDAVVWHCFLAVTFTRPGVRGWYGRRKGAIDRVVGAGLALLGAWLATIWL
jgi:RhtB (resistance to homoserine/threonine) family protein